MAAYHFITWVGLGLHIQCIKISGSGNFVEFFIASWNTAFYRANEWRVGMFYVNYLRHKVHYNRKVIVKLASYWLWVTNGISNLSRILQNHGWYICYLMSPTLDKRRTGSFSKPRNLYTEWHWQGRVEWHEESERDTGVVMELKEQKDWRVAIRVK